MRMSTREQYAVPGGYGLIYAGKIRTQSTSIWHG